MGNQIPELTTQVELLAQELKFYREADEEQQKQFERLRGKVEGNGQPSYDRRLLQVELKLEALHRRLDQAQASKRSKWQGLWPTLILSFLSLAAVIVAIIALFL